MTDPRKKKGLQDLNRLKLSQNNAPHLSIVPHTQQRAQCQTTPPAKPHRNEVWGILPDKRRVPCGWPACLRRQPPRVAFRNNDIYVVEMKIIKNQGRDITRFNIN